jgi:hypothetical protein
MIHRFTIAGAEAYHMDVSRAIHILDAGHFALDGQAHEVIRLIELFCKNNCCNKQNSHHAAIIVKQTSTSLPLVSNLLLSSVILYWVILKE